MSRCTGIRRSPACRKDSAHMAEPAVLAAREGGVATLTLNRPRALNALDRDLTLALREGVLAAEHDPGVRCLVLRGGEHFMAGGDLKWVSTPARGRSGAGKPGPVGSPPH